MTVQKKRFNILDLAVCLAVICSVCLIFFHESISEIFEDPQMETIEIAVDISDSDVINQLSGINATEVVFMSDEITEKTVNMTVVGMTVIEKPNASPERARMILSFTGYKRFGKIYTEQGERIYGDSQCVIVAGEVRAEGTVAVLQIG